MDVISKARARGAGYSEAQATAVRQAAAELLDAGGPERVSLDAICARAAELEPSVDHGHAHQVLLDDGYEVR